MWRTPLGDRLDANESILFREVVTSLVEELRNEQEILNPNEEAHQTGVAVFDDLAYPQRLLMLEAVTYALTANDSRVPEHSAVNEGAIAAAFAHMEDMIEIEIDLWHEEPSNDKGVPGKRIVCGEDYPSVRQLLVDAVGDDECDEYGRPDALSDNLEMWQAMVERARDRIFWDYDFEWHHGIVATRALQTLGVARGGEFACEVASANSISVASILRGFRRMQEEVKEEWSRRKISSHSRKQRREIKTGQL
jgi:hypothetical protein